MECFYVSASGPKRILPRLTSENVFSVVACHRHRAHAAFLITYDVSLKPAVIKSLNSSQRRGEQGLRSPSPKADQCSAT